MKKFILVLSALFAIVACSSDDTTVKDNNNSETPDPSFDAPTVETTLYFLFTNSEGENILDPESPAYIGDEHLPQCKIFWENDYIPTTTEDDIFWIRNTSNPTSSATSPGVYHYYLTYFMDYHFCKNIPNYTFDGYEKFRDLTLDRMWMKAQILFDDGTTYNIYAKLGKYNDGTYAMGANEIYINDELFFQGNPDQTYLLEVPIVKDE